MSSETKNQGEGNRDAAERYNEAQEEFVHSEEGKQQIDKAGEIEIDDEELEAEDEGKSRSKE